MSVPDPGYVPLPGGPWLIDFALITERRIQEPKQVLARVVAMLIAMIRSLETRQGQEMRG